MGVVAVVFIALFSAVAGYVTGSKAPGLLNAKEQEHGFTYSGGRNGADGVIIYPKEQPKAKPTVNLFDTQPVVVPNPEPPQPDPLLTPPEPGQR